MGPIRVLNSYPLHRVVVAGLSFGSAVISARLLEPGHFSALMSAAFVAKFLQILNLGATSGYFVSRYSGEPLLAEDPPGAERRFLQFYLLQMGGLGLVLLIATAFWVPQYRTGAIAFLLLAPLFVVEPALRYRRNFSFSLAPELLLSLALLSAAFAQITGLLGAAPALIYLPVAGVLAIGLLALGLARHMAALAGHGATFGPRDYVHVLALGRAVYLGTALFLMASSIDRLLLPLYGSAEEIGVYFLAHQLSVGSMIFVTAINFVNTVHLGEARKDQSVVDRDMVVGKFRSAALVAFGSYLALGIGGLVLESVFLPASFAGLTRVILILGAGLSCFYTSNAITPIVAYYRRQMPLSMSMGAVALALLVNNAAVYANGGGIVWLATGTALALAMHAAFSVWFTFATLRRQAMAGHRHAG